MPSDSGLEVSDGVISPEICSPLRLLSNPQTSAVNSELEVELVQHYLDKLISVLLLPNVQKGFYADYRSRVVSMMVNCESVKCAVLACCASNKYMLSDDVRYQDTSSPLSMERPFDRMTVESVLYEAFLLQMRNPSPQASA